MLKTRINVKIVELNTLGFFILTMNNPTAINLEYFKVKISTHYNCCSSFGMNTYSRSMNVYTLCSNIIQSVGYNFRYLEYDF